MLVCPVCGFRNPGSNDRCIKCSAILHREQEIINRAMYDGAEKARKKYWRDVMDVPLERLERWLTIPSWMPRDDLPHRFPFTAGGLSIVPGMGQFYNHQVSKGIVLGVLWMVQLGLCLVTLHDPWSNPLLISLVIGWMLIWSDAVGTAIRCNGQRWSLRNSLAMLFGGMFLVGVTITALQFFGLSFVSFIRVRQDVHKPIIRERDHVWVNNMRYWFSEPKRGDLIFFDPPRFTAERGADVYSVNVKSYFQRVIGIAGDRVEKKGRVFYRNGYELPAAECPIGGDVLPDFSVSVPAGHVLAPVTIVPQDVLSNTIAGLLGGGSIGTIYAMAEGSYVFPHWEEKMMVPENQIFGKAVAVVNPPPHRQWL